jgi:hypothetical protein
MDPVAMGRHWLAMNALRTKTKKKVDTKASKGEAPCVRVCGWLVSSVET